MKHQTTMDEGLRALLVYDRDHPLEALRQVLGGLGIRTVRARSCDQSKNWLEHDAPPHLVFTDTVLPDGSWAEVVRLARQCAVGTQVIVVSRVVDVDLYIRVLEGHAFDFIVPPFTDSDLAHVVRCATRDLSRPHPRAA